MGNRRITLLFVALLVIGCVAGVLVPAGLGWDFANFYDAGRRVAAGQVTDLYQPSAAIDDKAPQGTTGFYGTPLSAIFYVPMSRLSPPTALIWFKIENVAAFAAAFVLLYSFYRVFSSANAGSLDRFAVLFTGLCLLYQPFWTVFRVGGQTTPTALLLVTMAMILHTSARFWGSAICLVLAVLIKPAFAPILIFLVGVSGLSFLWRTALTLIVAGVLSLALLGWPVHENFLNLLRQTNQGTWEWYYNSSIFVVLNNVQEWRGPAAAGAPIFAAVTLALQAAVVVGIAWLTIRGHRARWIPEATRHFDVMVAILLCLLWSRTVWEHYLALLFLPLVYVVANRHRFSRGALMVVAAIAGVSVFQNLIFTNWLRSFGLESLPALVAVGLLKSAPLLLTVWFVVRYRRELSGSYAGWSAREGANA